MASLKEIVAKEDEEIEHLHLLKVNVNGTYVGQHFTEDVELLAFLGMQIQRKD